MGIDMHTAVCAPCRHPPFPSPWRRLFNTSQAVQAPRTKARTGSTLLRASFTDPTLSPIFSPLSATTSLSRGSSIGTRDVIWKREGPIKAKGREAKRAEAARHNKGDESADEDYRPLASLVYAKVGRLSRKRSKSTGDADALLRGPVAAASISVT